MVVGGIRKSDPLQGPQIIEETTKEYFSVTKEPKDPSLKHPRDPQENFELK